MIPIRDSQPSYGRPVVTTLLVAVNALVFLYQISLDSFSSNDFVSNFGFTPDRFQWFDLFTSMFLHGGWMHLIGNMMFLWVLGDNVEDILGHWKYLIFYILSGVAAAGLQYAINPDSRVPMIGASGAIAGVMGAYMIKFRHSRIEVVSWFIILFYFEIPAGILMLYWLGLQFLNGFGSIVQQHANQGGTAWFAHIGGFAAGVVLIFVLKTRDRYFLHRELSW